MAITTVFFQMLALLVMIGAGVIASKTAMLDAHTNSKISSLIVNILNPLLVFSSSAGAAGTISTGLLGQVFLVAAAMFAFLILVGMLLAPRFDKDTFQRKLFQLMFVFSNLGFIGIPVVSSILGSEYVVFVSIFILVYNIVFYTYGITLLDGQFSLKTLRAFFNAGNIICLLALVVVIWAPPIPGFLMTSTTYLGNAASPLALMSIGYTLANSDLKRIFRQPRLYLFTLVKLLILPFIMFQLLRLFPVDPVLLPVSLVMFGMPVGNMPFILGTQRGIDVSTCSAAIIMSTVLCVLTIPVLMMMI